MKYFTLACLTSTLALAAAPASAQSRVETQLFLEIRTLQAQVQRLQLSINEVAEKVAKAEGRVDSVTRDTLEGFVNQKLLIDGLASNLRALSERQSDTSVQVLALTQEMKAIREGLSRQQDSLTQIITLLQQAGVGAGAIDPGNPPTGLPRPDDVPPSPAEYYRTAFNYFYAGQYEAAVMALNAAIERFPAVPDAGRAQLAVAESQDKLGKTDEALAAYATAIKVHKDPEIVAEAYYKQGLLQERTGRKTEGIKSLQQGYKIAPPGSGIYLLIEQNLKRLGIVK